MNLEQEVVDQKQSINVLSDEKAILKATIVELEEVLIGGVNEDWPVEEHPDSIFSS